MTTNGYTKTVKLVRPSTSLFVLPLFRRGAQTSLYTILYFSSGWNPKGNPAKAGVPLGGSGRFCHPARGLSSRVLHKDLTHAIR